jgi:hypothetical protein
MALFVAENPVLGAGTKLAELSGAAGNPAGNPALNYYKPTTREIISFPLGIISDPTADIVGPVFIAPWACTLLSAKFVCVTPASASVTLSVYNVPYASQAEAATSGNLLVVALNVDSGVTANTVAPFTLSATKSFLNIGANDMISYSFSAAPMALSGALLQLEFAQTG